MWSRGRRHKDGIWQSGLARPSRLWHHGRVRYVSCLVALALAVAGPASGQILAPAPTPPTPEDAGFQAWLGGFRAAEAARGVPATVLDATLGGLTFSPRVVELDNAQPDDSGGPSLFADYLNRRLEPVRIGRGAAVRDAMTGELTTLEARTGVPATIVLGIWGMESSYGAVTGGFDVPRSLASLAYDGRRRELFTRELSATVEIVRRGLIDRSQLTGSWAGAMGQPQFLPSSYLKFAQDGDGDGRADIWGSRADVVASIAAYLARSGWQRGQGWGMRVIVPPGLDRARVRNLVAPASCARVLEKHSRWIPVGEWRALGLVSAVGWPADDQLATLVEPDGVGGSAYLTFGNYRVLLAYNCSNFYALSVALLGDALR